jgi:hypothetical protein
VVFPVRLSTELATFPREIRPSQASIPRKPGAWFTRPAWFVLSLSLVPLVRRRCVLWLWATGHDGEQKEQERENENTDHNHHDGFCPFFFALYFPDDGMALPLG